MDPALVARLRADLSAAGYTVAGMVALLGPVAYRAMARGHRTPADLLTREHDEPIAALVRLWVLGLPVDVSRVAHALPGLGVDGVVALRLALLDPSGDWARGAVDLRPHGDVEAHRGWVVSDLTGMATRSAMDPDHVVGVGGASVTLASWAPRPGVGRALDLGTGSGVQVLYLAEHTTSRVATDVSDRALRCARLTAALSEVEVDVRLGAAFEPVADEAFDLIVANPPFVITPRHGGSTLLSYRDAGAPGDDFVATLVGGVREHLAPGGIATFLGNWEVQAGREWSERIKGWLEGSGLDALVVQRDQQDPSEYAETWAGDAGLNPAESAFEEAHQASLEDFAAREVEHIGMGVIVLQRPAEDRPSWQHFADVRGPVDEPMGPHVLTQVRARSWLAMHTDEEVLAVPWTLAPDVVQEQVGAPGAADPSMIRLRQQHGFGHVAQVDTLVAALVGACDGELSARQVIVAVAALLDLQADQALGHAVIALRELVAFGLLR